VSALWRVGLKARGLSVGLVGFVCTYCALSAGMGAGLHKDYAGPAPVRHFSPPLFRIPWSSLISSSSGVLSAPTIHRNALPALGSSCGWHYLLRYYSTSPCTFGRRVVCRSMISGTSSSSTGIAHITSDKGLNTHRGARLRECSCKSWFFMRKLLTVHPVIPLRIPS
jgi:hypothetical protein